MFVDSLKTRYFMNYESHLIYVPDTIIQVNLVTYWVLRVLGFKSYKRAKNLNDREYRKLSTLQKVYSLVKSWRNFFIFLLCINLLDISHNKLWFDSNNLFITNIRLKLKCIQVRSDVQSIRHCSNTILLKNCLFA